MDTISLTYKEIADRFGVKADSARKMVRRKRWAKVPGNDGQVRILVPVDVLPCLEDSPGDGDKDDPRDRPLDSLQVKVRELEVEVLGLRDLVEAERRRADAAEVDRDRWHQMASRPWWRRFV